MKTIFALPLLALGLAACQAYPATPYGPGPAPYQSAPRATPAYNYRAIGTEPFWDLTIGRDLIFTDRGTGISVVEQAPRPIRATAGATYRGGQIDVTVVRRTCSDGMSERNYPDTVSLTVEGRLYRGCGAPASFFTQVGENGASQTMFTLANTNWRVVSIDRLPVPPRGYYLNFQPDRLSGRLGCNTIGAGYSVGGSTLRTGALLMTRMACPDTRFESLGTRIMGQAMTLGESGGRMTLSNRVGTIELMRAR